MNKIGVLFDIDKLGGGFYGFQAYHMLFSCVKSDLFNYCRLSDGDTLKTLTGSSNEYCIMIECDDENNIKEIRNCIKGAKLDAFAGFQSDLEVSKEQLVFSIWFGYDSIAKCATNWVLEAWNKKKEN